MENFKFFSEEDALKIEKAIFEAEKKTSGEIRVRVERRAGRNHKKTVLKAFKSTGMEKTKLRNGVMFFIAAEEKVFIIYGDKEINRVVPKGFWEEIRDTVIEGFKREEYTEALSKGIEMAGEKLSLHFPYTKDDSDELSNKISYGSI